MIQLTVATVIVGAVLKVYHFLHEEVARWTGLVHQLTLAGLVDLVSHVTGSVNTSDVMRST